MNTDRKRIWCVEHNRETGVMELVTILVLRERDGVIELARAPKWSHSRTFAVRDVRLSWTREEAVRKFVFETLMARDKAQDAAEQAQAVYGQALSFERETIGATEQASV